MIWHLCLVVTCSMWCIKQCRLTIMRILFFPSQCPYPYNFSGWVQLKVRYTGTVLVKLPATHSNTIRSTETNIWNHWSNIHSTETNIFPVPVNCLQYTLYCRTPTLFQSIPEGSYALNFSIFLLSATNLSSSNYPVGRVLIKSRDKLVNYMLLEISSSKLKWSIIDEDNT